MFFFVLVDFRFHRWTLGPTHRWTPSTWSCTCRSWRNPQSPTRTLCSWSSRIWIRHRWTSCRTFGSSSWDLPDACCPFIDGLVSRIGSSSSFARCCLDAITSTSSTGTWTFLDHLLPSSTSRGTIGDPSTVSSSLCKWRTLRTIAFWTFANPGLSPGTPLTIRYVKQIVFCLSLIFRVVFFSCTVLVDQIPSICHLQQLFSSLVSRRFPVGEFQSCSTNHPW